MQLIVQRALPPTNPAKEEGGLSKYRKNGGVRLDIVFVLQYDGQLVGGGRGCHGSGLELGHLLHGRGRGLQAAVGNEQFHGGRHLRGRWHGV